MTEKFVEKVHESPAQEVSRALVEASAEAERQKLDETVPGGRFVVNGQTVSANGEPVKG